MAAEESLAGSSISRAVVVGAGLAGLTAAYRLEREGVEVTVLETGPGPGGRAQTETHDGYVIDTGPDTLTDSYTSYLGLLTELGLDDRLVTSSAVVGLVRDGRLIDIDPAKPLRLLRSPMLSFGAKLRLVRGYLKLRKAIKSVDSYDMAASAHLDDPSETAYDYSVRHFGPEVTEYLIDPVMRLTTGSGAKVSSRLNVLAALGAWSAPVRNVRGGLGVLPAALARRVSVRYGATVTRVDDSDTGVTVSWTDESGAHEITADQCVIASMYHVGLEIWPKLKEVSPEFTDKLSNVKLISISLGYTVRTRSPSYIVQVPTVEDPEALLIFLQHNKSPDRVPEGKSLVTIYTDTAVTDSYLERSDAEIEAWAAGIVEKVCPELAGHRELAVVTRWPYAGYHAGPGFWKRSADLFEAVPTTGRVQLAGDLFGAGSMESAVRSGERAARRILGKV